MRKDVIAKELEDIYERRGVLTCDDVVEEATNEEHPLHEEFEWNNDIAAHEHRLWQAGQLIRSVKVTVITDKETFTTRSWRAMRWAGAPDAPRGYMPDERVRVDPALRSVLLQQMHRDWTSLRRRYDHLSEFWQLVEEATDEQEM
jgi:hypothetical protein